MKGIKIHWMNFEDLACEAAILSNRSDRDSKMVDKKWNKEAYHTKRRFVHICNGDDLWIDDDCCCQLYKRPATTLF